MLPLDDNLWSTLNPGRWAPTYPALLRALTQKIAEGSFSRGSLGDLCTMCHQWSTYDSTLAVVPHLIDICRGQQPQSNARMGLLAWVGWCVACIKLNRQDGAEQLQRWFNGSVAVARDLIAESLPFAGDGDDQQPSVRELLAAFAACHGNPALAFILFELEAGGFQCDHCHSFIIPMESSMNPFWAERNK